MRTAIPVRLGRRQESCQEPAQKPHGSRDPQPVPQHGGRECECGVAERREGGLSTGRPRKRGNRIPHESIQVTAQCAGWD